jgi:nucleoid-associated protein YgaU
MSVFQFLKSAGDKVIGGVSNASDALLGHIRGKKVGEQVEVRVEEGKAIITGEAASQEEREKIILAAGNVEGVEVVEEAIQVAQPAAEARFYTVKRGDTLSAIAREMYGKASLYSRIFEANRPLLSDPDRIYPGQVLRIPD